MRKLLLIPAALVLLLLFPLLFILCKTHWIDAVVDWCLRD